MWYKVLVKTCYLIFHSENLAFQTQAQIIVNKG